MGVDEFINKIHAERSAEAATQGKTWCCHWGHDYSPIGIECVKCVKQDEYWAIFWALWEKSHKEEIHE